jgi:hypothetical protein
MKEWTLPLRRGLQLDGSEAGIGAEAGTHLGGRCTGAAGDRGTARAGADETCRCEFRRGCERR